MARVSIDDVLEYFHSASFEKVSLEEKGHTRQFVYALFDLIVCFVGDGKTVHIKDFGDFSLPMGGVQLFTPDGTFARIVDDETRRLGGRNG